jgi:agmatinase
MKTYKSFLEKEVKPAKNAGSARFHIISAPYEETVSYGGGTSRGPEAIINASQYLEYFMGENEPLVSDIYTVPQIKVSAPKKKVFARIAGAVLASLKIGALPVLLGGEHTVSYGMAKALREYFGDGKIGIVHFDAHADLRNSYGGKKFSHACVMRRIHEDFRMEIFQIGTRGYAKEELIYRRENNIRFIDAQDLAKKKPDKILPDDFPDKIYISFDVDALDPSIMPSTGTPEPGGLLWNETVEILRKIAQQKYIAAFDIVELAPIKGQSHADYTAAKLACLMMGLAIKGRN